MKGKLLVCEDCGSTRMIAELRQGGVLIISCAKDGGKVGEYFTKEV